MSKTLTKKYYDLELEEGFYYAKSEMGNVFILEINPCWTKMYYKCEILDKVPDYKQFADISKKVKRIELDKKKLVKTFELLQKAIRSGSNRIYEIIEERDKLSNKCLQLENQLDYTQKYAEVMIKRFNIARETLEKYSAVSGLGRDAFLALEQIKGVK